MATALKPNAVSVAVPAASKLTNGPYAMMYAKTTDPMRLPTYTQSQRLSTLAQLTLWINAAMGASIASPVKSSAPVMIVMISPTGKTAPRMSWEIPGLAAPNRIATSVAWMPVEQTVARAAPMAMNAPDRNPRRTMFQAGSPTLYFPESPAFATIATGGWNTIFHTPL